MTVNTPKKVSEEILTGGTLDIKTTTNGEVWLLSAITCSDMIIISEYNGTTLIEIDRTSTSDRRQCEIIITYSDYIRITNNAGKNIQVKYEYWVVS